MAYALANMGPGRSNIEYNLDAGPEVYINSSIHTLLTSYMEVARSVHRADYDLRIEEHLDPEIVMRVGKARSMGGFGLATTSTTLDLLL